MRRTLALLAVITTLIFAAGQSFGQLTTTGAGKKPGGFTPSCSQSTNWLARATNVVLTTDKDNYDKLLCGLETDGVGCSDTLDVAYIWDAVDQATALFNLCSGSFPGTTSGTVSFTPYVGFQGDGATTFTFHIDTGFAPDSAGGFYSRNSASVGVYVLSNITSGGSGYNAGASNTGELLFTAQNFGDTQYRVNGGNKTVASATSQGQWIVTRVAASGASAIALYRNGSATPVDTDSSASDFVPRNNLFFFDLNNGSPPNFPTKTQMSSGFIGKGLSSAAAALVMARFQAFHCAYGNGVYAC